MKDLNCEYHRPWTTEVWLLLTVISNANGAILAFIRAFTFPWSWFVTVLFINLYRLFLINEPMPIIVDLGFSLLLQCVSSFGDFGWKLACSIAILSMNVIFFSVYLNPLVKEYRRLKQLQPGSKPVVVLLHPLSPMSFMLAFSQIYFLNGVFLIVAWLYPSNDGFYCYFQDNVGRFLVMESIVFLSCYKQLSSKKDGSTQGSGGTTSRGGTKTMPDGRKLSEQST